MATSMEESTVSDPIDDSFAFVLNRNEERGVALASYLRTCVQLGFLNHAERMMRKYPMENAKMVSDPKLQQLLHLKKHGVQRHPGYFGAERVEHRLFAKLTTSFNILLRAFLKEDEADKFVFFLDKMAEVEVEMNEKTVALAFIARGRYIQRGLPVPSCVDAAVDGLVEKGGKPRLQRLVANSGLSKKEREELESALRAFGVERVRNETTSPEYVHPILETLNDERPSYPNPYYGAFDRETIEAKLTETLRIESEGNVDVDDVHKAK